MKRLALALLLTAGAAAAQPASPPIENVTVTAAHRREVLRAFVQGLAAPARISGKLVRWQDGVCPLTIGLKPQFTQFISQHVRDVAARAGAPVNGRSSCKPNIEIVFTTTPQALMDNVRAGRPLLLGYHDNTRQAEALAKVTHPIQAWYTTATRDLRGKSVLDSALLQGTGEQVGTVPGDMSGMMFSSAAVNGSRLGDGKTSAFYHVIIVAEPGSLRDYEIGTLADYIAMLALTEPNMLDRCQSLPSILNLLVKGCAPVTALTGNDDAYLASLYRMGADQNLGVQRDQIAYGMQKSLERK